MLAAMKPRLAEPIDLGDIVSAACFLCVREWRSIIPMAVLTAAATIVTDVGLIPLASRAPAAPGGQSPTLPHIPVALAPLLALGTVLLLFNQLAFIRLSLEVWLNGRRRAAGAYLLAVRGFLPALAAAALTAAVFLIGTVTWIGIPVALYFLVCWFFAGQVCIGEGEANPFRALRRSRSIVRGAWWRTAAILAGVTLLALLPSILVGWVRTGGLAPALALSAVATAVAAPFLASAQTMIYLDRRVRKHESIALATSEPAEPV